MVSILDACNVADHFEYINTVEDMASVFAHLTNCDPYRDMLSAQVHGKTIAFSRVWWTEQSAVSRSYIPLGFVHPEWRRKGLGAAMLRYNEDRLREFASAARRAQALYEAVDERSVRWITEES